MALRFLLKEGKEEDGYVTTATNHSSSACSGSSLHTNQQADAHTLLEVEESSAAKPQTTLSAWAVRCGSRRRAAFISAICVSLMLLAVLSHGEEGTRWTGGWLHQLYRPSSSPPVASSTLSSASPAPLLSSSLPQDQPPQAPIPPSLPHTDTQTQTQTQTHTTLPPSPLLPSCPYYDDIPSPFPASFWYVKSPKTASSTLAGVFRSIGAHHGIPMLFPEKIIMNGPLVDEAVSEIYEHHEHAGLANHVRYSQQTAASFKHPFFLFASVREPVSQFHSQQVQKCLGMAAKAAKEKWAGNATMIAELHQELTALCFKENFEERMTAVKKLKENPQLNYLRDNGGDKKWQEQAAETVAATYNFIFVKERLYESLVAFAILYNLEFHDIAHASSKVRTGKYVGANEASEEINNLIRSKTRQDLELWHHADKLLDERIAEIASHCGGKAYFKQMVKVFESIQNAVNEQCDGYEMWYEKFGFNTTLSYWADNGVAPRCRDHVVKAVVKKGAFAKIE